MSEFQAIDSDFVDAPAQPSRYPFLKSLNLDMDVEERLSLHLDRLKVGDSRVFTSALGKDNDPEEVLNRWTVIFNKHLSEMNQPLLDLEKANLAKYGPRSICKPWSKRIDSVKDYYTNTFSKLSYDILSGSKVSGQGNLRPLNLDSAIKYLKNNTNSGLPYYCNKSKIKARLIERFDYLLSRKDPCILFTRTQEGDKTRNVWGYPAIDTLEEMRYYRPLLGYQSKLSWRSALIGPDHTSRMITQMILKSLNRGHVLISGDVSAFDASVTQPLIQAAFHYIKQLYQFDYRIGLDRICERFSSIGLLTPDGVAEGYHGVPSGSTFTNEVDSIIQYLIMKSLNISDDDFQIQGDDIVISSPADLVDVITERYSESHLPLNMDKSIIANDYCVYLQNLYHIDYMNDNGIIGGIYPTYRALGRIMFQERWSNFEDFDLGGIDYYSIRTISILENCKHHPLFRELVQFVYKLDKYSLRFSKSAISKYDAMVNNSSGVGGFLHNQYGDDIRGINSFETVKIIKELNR